MGLQKPATSERPQTEPPIGRLRLVEEESDTVNQDSLKIENLTKKFSGIAATRNANFTIAPGETLALLGENGAGKSTLMKVVAGVYPHGSYEGSISLGDRVMQFHSVRDAERNGVVLVPQELHIAPNLSIAENMFMGMLPKRFGIVDKVSLMERARDRLRFFGLNADPAAPASTISASEQRLMMISAALGKSAAKVLILDEPTASLTEGEAEHLFAKMEQVRKTGVIVIYISHRLDEIEKVCDRAVVMRNGEVVLVSSTVAGKRSQFVKAMIGHDPVHVGKKHGTPVGTPLLRVRNLTVDGGRNSIRSYVKSVSLDVRAGEIVGMFGLVGAGRTEFAKALFGCWPGKVSGQVMIADTSGLPATPAQAIGRGVAMLTEDRKRSGCIEGQSALFNMSAASLSGISRLRVIDSQKEMVRNFDLAQKLELRPMRLDLPIEGYSGGNQQKILLARWLATDPKVLIVDEPTQGVDIGARIAIYRLLRELADAGKAILLISSDIEEVVNETDRVIVMYKGQITGRFDAGVSRHDLMAAATGHLKNAA